MLEFVEGYNDVHKKSSEGLTFEEQKKKVPLFIQWDKRWGYEPYGTSDIGISGCGPTCMAMVIYSLTRNTEAIPPVLAAKIHERGILCGWYWNILEIHERSCFGLRCNCFAI